MNCSGGSDFHRDVIYDSENDCLATMPKQRLFVMDCKTNVWRELDINMPAGQYGVSSTLLYDPGHKLYVMMIPDHRGMRVFLFRYEPKAAKYK